MKSGYAHVSTHEQTLDLQIAALSGSCGRLSRCQLVLEAGMVDDHKGAFVGLEALRHGPVLGPGDTHVFIFFHTKGLVQAGCEHAHIHTDKVSGSGLERPGLTTTLAHARAGDQLVVWRLDRLGRSLRDLIDQVANLEQAGVGLVSLQERIDTATPSGKALFQICGVFAEFERNLISERTKAGLATARARGRRGGRKPKMTQATLDRAATLMREKRLTVREIARLSGCTPNTLYRYLTPDGQPRAGAPTPVR